MSDQFIDPAEVAQTLDTQGVERPVDPFRWDLLRRALLGSFLLALFVPAAWPCAAWGWLWAAGGWALLPFSAVIVFAAGPVGRVLTAAQLFGDLHQLELAERLTYLVGILATIIRLGGMGGSGFEPRAMLQALSPLEISLTLYSAFHILIWRGERQLQPAQP